MRKQTEYDLNRDLSIRSLLGIFEFDFGTHEVTYVNQKALDIMRTPALIGCCMHDIFFNKSDFDRLVSLLRSVEQTTFTFKAAADQQWLMFDCRLQDEVVCGIVRDVTDEMKADEELQNVKVVLDRFIYHSSHTLRAPISTTLGLIHLMEIENSADYVKLIKVQVNNLDDILSEIATIAYNNNTPMRFENFSVADEVASLIGFSSWSTNRLSISTRIKADSFCTDVSRFHTIVRSLLRFVNNALPESAVLHQVDLSFAIEEGVGLLKVKTNNLWLTDDNLSHAFEIFNRDVSGGAAGVGLFIVKQVVDRLKGQVEITSKKTGTEFCVKIPDQSKIMLGVSNRETVADHPVFTPYPKVARA